MPTLRNRERDTPDYRDQQQDDREISLGTGTILTIFFALALVCAVFFGLGYSMGRKSAQSSPTMASAPSTSSVFGGSKPSAGNSNNGQTAIPAAKNNRPLENTQSPRDPDATIVTAVNPPADEDAPPARPTAAPHTSTTLSVPVVVRQPKAPTSSVAAPAAMPETSPNGTAMVQVAAVSHQEDADVLISALKKRGYAVFIRQEPQDHLLHVQVGPFASKKDADAMRQRLLADGYNAIVK